MAFCTIHFLFGNKYVLFVTKCMNRKMGGGGWFYILRDCCVRLRGVYSQPSPCFPAHGLWGKVDAVVGGVCNWFGT